MKNSFKTLLALAVFAASALFASAQPAPKIAVIDLAKVFDGHYRTQEQQEKLKGFQTKINEDGEKMMKEGRTLVDKYKELIEQAKNPVLTADARKTAETDAEKQLQLVQQAEQKMNEFRNDAARSMQQQVQSFRQLLIEEISKLATDLAKKRGATILVEKGATLYFDPAYDITEEVAAEIVKTRPAGAGASAAGTAPKGDAPAVTFPGAKK